MRNHAWHEMTVRDGRRQTRTKHIDDSRDADGADGADGADDADADDADDHDDNVIALNRI